MTESVMTSDLTLNQLKANDNTFGDDFDSHLMRDELNSNNNSNNSNIDSNDNELRSGLPVSSTVSPTASPTVSPTVSPMVSPIDYSVNSSPQSSHPLSSSSPNDESKPQQNHSISLLNNNFNEFQNNSKQSLLLSTDLSLAEDKDNKCLDLLSDNNNSNNKNNNLYNFCSNNCKRIELSEQKMMSLTTQEFRHHWNEQQLYINYIETQLKQLNRDKSDLISLRESEEKLKQQQLEANRRENVLVMRLTTKEQEMQECLNQIQELKQSQVPSSGQLQSTLIDPAINLIFEKMRKEVDSCRARVEEMQNELNAWKFTPDSTTGKRLMSKCRLLYQENEELGKMIESGRIAKLEGELALQKNFSEELKKSQSEIDEFLLELDEDVEGMQNTIYYLQQQLKDSKEKLAKYESTQQNDRQCVHQNNSDKPLDTNDVKNSEVFERTLESSDNLREGFAQNNGSTVDSMDSEINDNNESIISDNSNEEMTDSAINSETTLESNNNNYLSVNKTTNSLNECLNKRTTTCFDDHLDIDDDYKQPSLKVTKLNDYNKTSDNDMNCSETSTLKSNCIEINGQSNL